MLLQWSSVSLFVFYSCNNHLQVTPKCNNSYLLSCKWIKNRHFLIFFLDMILKAAFLARTSFRLIWNSPNFTFSRFLYVLLLMIGSHYTPRLHWRDHRWPLLADSYAKWLQNSDTRQAREAGKSVHRAGYPCAIVWGYHLQPRVVFCLLNFQLSGQYYQWPASN